jgi:hypothetical protein
MGIQQGLSSINERADLCTLHPDALPWPGRLSEEELRFNIRLCGLPAEGMDAARAYLGKELAQLADIERHISICLGLLSGHAAASNLLGGAPMVNAMMHFAAEEFMHSNMFYRYVELLLGNPLDLSDETLDKRLGLFLGPETTASKLVALLGSAYPGESVITIFEHRMRMLDPRSSHFITRMILAHGLDEARHIQFDHFTFAKVLPALTEQEWRDSQRICRAMGAFNHGLSQRYAAAVTEVLPIDFVRGNQAARAQLALTQKLLEETLSGRSFRSADQAMSTEDQAMLLDFAGTRWIHPQGGAPWE